MRDPWLNTGFDTVLRPFTEPAADYCDPERIGNFWPRFREFFHLNWVPIPFSGFLTDRSDGWWTFLALCFDIWFPLLCTIGILPRSMRESFLVPSCVHNFSSISSRPCIWNLWFLKWVCCFFERFTQRTENPWISPFACLAVLKTPQRWPITIAKPRYYSEFQRL